MINSSIIYICTGKYSSLWLDFYRSAQAYLLPGGEKTYHIFTDDEGLIESLAETQGCVTHRIQHETWPGPSLHRYDYIGTVANDLIAEQSELTLFFNANTLFHQRVDINDLGLSPEHRFVGVEHPGYAGLHAWLCPFERRKRLSCWIPWRHRGPYLQGCLQGGYTQEVIHMAEQLSRMTASDTHQGQLARWHDESYWNHWATLNCVHVLPPEYATPWTTGQPYPSNARILMRLKPKGFRPSNGRPAWLRQVGGGFREMLNRLLLQVSP